MRWVPDVGTALLFGGLSHAMMAALLAVFWWRSRSDKGFGWWVANELQLALATLLLLLVAWLPVGLVLCVSNVLLLASAPAMETGLRIALGRVHRPALVLRWLVAALVFGLWLASWLMGAGYTSRALIFSLGLLVQLGLFASFLLGVRAAAWRLPVRLLLASVLIVALADGVRIVQLLNEWGSAKANLASALPLLTLSGLFAAFIRLCAMLVLMHGRVEQGLRQAQAELERRANVDAQSGLASRAHFDIAAPQLLANAARQGLPLSLLLCDLDHFKQVNDRFGHQAGDAVLRDFGAALRQVVREGDLPGRLGGDEFAVLLYDCDLLRAEQVAERLRQITTGLQLPDASRLSLSIGLCLITPPMSFAQAYRCADQALYAAKAAGRNCVQRSMVSEASLS